jgi:hypothetical protein
MQIRDTKMSSTHPSESDKLIEMSAEEMKKWKAIVDKASQKTYYYNAETKKTTWTRPPGFLTEEERRRKSDENVLAAFRAKQGKKAPIAHFDKTDEEERKAKEAAEQKAKEEQGFWKAVEDKSSGKTYWYHTKTQETTWEQPEDFVA